MKLRVTVRANRDLLNIAEHITAENPRAALQVRARIEQVFSLLTSAPLIGRRGQGAGIREMPVRGLPFLVVYRVTDEAVEILTVFHTSRDPETKRAP